MLKFKKLFKALRLIIRQPSLLNILLDRNEERKKEFIKSYPGLEALPSIPINSFFLQEEVNPTAFLSGGSMVTDLALLKSLAKSFATCDYLEIGSWRGESLANVAPYCQSCTSVNLPDTELRKLGVPEASIQQHYFFSKKYQHITTIREDSRKLDFTSLNKKFDLIFVDGDHHYESVLSDTQKAFSILKDENSVIIWHDYAVDPEMPRFEVFKAILDGTPMEFKNHLYHVSNTLCALFSRKKFDTKDISYPVLPDKIFKTRIEIIE